MRKIVSYIIVLVIIGAIAASIVYFFPSEKNHALSLENCQAKPYDEFLDGLEECDPKDKARAFEVSKELKNLKYSDTCNLRRHKKISNYFLNQNDMRSFNIILNDVKDAVLRSNDGAFLGKWYLDKCTYYVRIGRHDLAYQCLLKGKQYKSYYANSSYAFDEYNLEIIILDYYSQSLLAEKKAIEFLRVFKATEPITEATVSGLLADIYRTSDRYKEAEYYYKKSLKLTENETDYFRIQFHAATNNNLALCYYEQKKFKQAYSLIRDVKAVFLESGYSKTEFQFNKMLANYYLMKSHVSPEKSDLKSLDSIITVTTKFKDYAALSSAKYAKAVFIINTKGNEQRANQLMHECIELSKKYLTTSSEVYFIEKLLFLFPNEDVKYYKRLLSIKDGIYLNQQNSFDKFARIEYEVDRYQEEAEKSNLLLRRFIVYSSIVFVVLLLLLIRKRLYFFVRYRVLKLPLPKFHPIRNRPKGTAVHIGVHSGITVERNRIARELHDNVLGKMTGLRLALLKFKTHLPQEKQEKYFQKVQSIDFLSSEIRKSTTDRFRELSEAYGQISKLLHHYILEASESADFNIRLHIDDEVDFDALEARVKVHTYRIVQELVTNTMKYANASFVRISFEATEDRKFVFSYSDDGVGFDFPKTPKPGKGLSNILVRGNEISAKFEISTNKGNGFHLRMIIPDAFVNINQTTISHEHQDFIY